VKVSGGSGTGGAGGPQNPTIITGPAGTTRDLEYQTAGVVRWRWRVNSDAETGAPNGTGSNLELNRYDDAGALLAQVLLVNRRLGTATWTPNITFSGQIVVVGSSTFTARLQLSNGATLAGGIDLPTTRVAVDTVLGAGHHTVRVDASGALRTITFPNPATTPGRQYVIIKGDTSANAVRLSTPAGVFGVGGDVTYDLTYPGQVITLQSDGTDWNILGMLI
jgi:hypothetical protein